MRLPIRAVAVTIRKNRVLLMHRINKGKEYWTFPGGGVEKGETVKEAVLRELKEETSITAEVRTLLYHLKYRHTDGSKSTQYFYRCSYLSGRPKLGNFNEKEQMSKENNFYKPAWIPIAKIPRLLLFPLEIRNWLIKDSKDNFRHIPRKAILSYNQ